MYIRKTKDVYTIESQYGTECNAESMQEARQLLKDYRENVQYSVWIAKHREKIEKGAANV